MPVIRIDPAGFGTHWRGLRVVLPYPPDRECELRRELRREIDAGRLTRSEAEAIWLRALWMEEEEK